METGRFVRDPAKEPGDDLIAGKGSAITLQPGQFGIGESLVDRLVADWMHRDGFASLLRFGNGVVPLNAVAKRTFTQQPTGDQLLAQPFFPSVAFFFFIVS